MNLYQETLTELENNGKTINDIKFCYANIEDDMFSVNRSLYFTWDNFVKISRNLCYSNGFGACEIPESLQIVGDGWWLERWEYDGAEGWKYREHIAPPTHFTDVMFAYDGMQNVIIPVGESDPKEEM